MQVVIDIDEKYLEYIRKAVEVEYTAPPYFAVQHLWESALNGTMLPKGHGNLIDVSEYFSKEFGDAREFLDKATTIIEAEREKQNICDTNPFNDSRFGG